MMQPVVVAPPPPPPPPPVAMMAPPPPPPPPARMEQPNFYRLRNTPSGATPARVALLLPLTGGTAETRALAQALERAAELAVFDAKNNDILLMPRDDGATPEKAAAAAAKAIQDGAEIIIGPLFAQNVTAVAPVARGKVPVIAFSSDRSVGGNGTYLLSFQPETEVNRIVTYAARTGHNSFAALIPKTPYGQKVESAFRQSVARSGARIAAITPFDERAQAVAEPTKAIAQAGADAILIPEGGVVLQAIAPALVVNGVNARRARLLGTGLWDDAIIANEPALAQGWFAAPAPDAFRNFTAHYREVYGAAPPRIATLSYDALSLVALLARGRPGQRFTDAALTDTHGFVGIDGIFRFSADGAAERGLAILQVNDGGFSVVDPAPKAFPQPGF